jgi:hypothetical protein
MAYKTFVNGLNLSASELNTYLMNQAVIVFTDAAARTSAIASPTEGMHTYLASTKVTQVYNGTTWVDVSSAALSPFLLMGA